MYLGIWHINDLLTFPVNTYTYSTGAATDADGAPAYRVYEDEVSTAILTGSMAKLDDANTVGFYSEQITVSEANGFEFAKCYTIYITSVVAGVTITTVHTFQVRENFIGIFDSDFNDVDDALANLQTSVNEIDNKAGSIEQDINTIQDERLPQALVDGRMDSSVGAMAANVLTATAIAADAITDAKVASDVTIASVTGAVGSVTGAVTVGTNNDKTGYGLSAAAIQAIWAYVLESGKTIEVALLDIWAVCVGDAVVDDAESPTSITYDSPDGTVQRTHTRAGTTRTQS